MREECDFLAQQNGALQQQLRQTHDHQAQMRERYGKEAQKHIDSVVADATAREAEFVCNVHAGIVDPALLRQLEQIRHELEGTRQEAENSIEN